MKLGTAIGDANTVPGAFARSTRGSRGASLGLATPAKSICGSPDSARRSPPDGRRKCHGIRAAPERPSGREPEMARADETEPAMTSVDQRPAPGADGQPG